MKPQKDPCLTWHRPLGQFLGQCSGKKKTQWKTGSWVIQLPSGFQSPHAVRFTVCAAGRVLPPPLMACCESQSKPVMSPLRLHHNVMLGFYSTDLKLEELNLCIVLKQMASVAFLSSAVFSLGQQLSVIYHWSDGKTIETSCRHGFDPALFSPRSHSSLSSSHFISSLGSVVSEVWKKLLCYYHHQHILCSVNRLLSLPCWADILFHQHRAFEVSGPRETQIWQRFATCVRYRSAADLSQLRWLPGVWSTSAASVERRKVGQMSSKNTTT